VSRPSRIPSYRLHKPSGQAIIVIRGKTIYLGHHGSLESKAEYNRVLAEWLAQGTSGPPSRGGASSGSEPGADLTVSELILEYWIFVQDYYRKNGQPTSQVEQIKHSLRPLRQLYGDTAAKDFGPLALKAVRQEFIKAGFCRDEINRKTQKIVRLFKWAVANERVPPSVHHGLKAVEGLKRGRCDVRESKPVKPVPHTFVDAVLPRVSRQVAAMIELQRLTGMRPGEVVIMRTCDIDTGGRVWVYTPESHKTEHHGPERRIYVGPNAIEVLKPGLKTELADYLFSPRESMAERAVELRKARRTRVQPSQQNRRKRSPKRIPAEKYRVTGYALAIRRACDRAFPHPTLSELPEKELTDDQRAELKAWRRALIPSGRSYRWRGLPILIRISVWKSRLQRPGSTVAGSPVRTCPGRPHGRAYDDRAACNMARVYPTLNAKAAYPPPPG
jgi:integrase